MSFSPETPFSAVVLCGGRSRRMGVDKAFLPFNGVPLWQHQLDFLRRFGPGQVMLSGRRDVVYPDPAEIVLDAPGCSGPVAGLSAALENCRHPHLLVLAVDMPKVAPAMIEEMLLRRQPSCGAIPFIGEAPEPLLAVYPREALIVARQQLTHGNFKARDFARACERDGLVQRLTCGVAQLHNFENWNQPDDLTQPD